MCNGPIHICTGTNRRFIVRVQFFGCRNYILKSRHRDSARAMMALGRVFASGKYHRGDVIMTADYYEPVVIVEMVKKL